jgi:nucleoid-associated protein Lsr2
MHRVDVQLEDDLTGGPADETILFSVDGRSYEIDLNARHAAEFRHRLGPFTDHARPVRSQRSRVTRRSAASRERSRQIRLWAEQRGFALSPHGRLPGNVIQQYDREHGADRSAEGPTRRLAGQRTSSSRQARKTGASTRSPRRRAAPRGALPGRARQPAQGPCPFGTGLLTRPSHGAAAAGTIPPSATYGSGPGSSCLSQYHPPGCPPSRPQPARREGSWNA